MASPASQGPSALAALNAAWWDAAARVCASRATSIRCDCNTVASAPIVATASTTGSTVHGERAASGYSSRIAIDHSRIHGVARTPMRSNSQPPARLPRMPPMPNAASAKGTNDSPVPVTSTSAGAR